MFLWFFFYTFVKIWNDTKDIILLCYALSVIVYNIVLTCAMLFVMLFVYVLCFCTMKISTK